MSSVANQCQHSSCPPFASIFPLLLLRRAGNWRRGIMDDYKNANDTICLNLTKLSVPPCQEGRQRSATLIFCQNHPQSFMLTVRNNRMSSTWRVGLNWSSTKLNLIFSSLAKNILNLVKCSAGFLHSHYLFKPVPLSREKQAGCGNYLTLKKCCATSSDLQLLTVSGRKDTKILLTRCAA